MRACLPSATSCVSPSSSMRSHLWRNAADACVFFAPDFGARDFLRASQEP